MAIQSRRISGILSVAASAALLSHALSVQSIPYAWNNVRIGGGGGFVPNIIFNPTKKGVAYARTDIGAAYRLNPDDSWTPLLDFANDTHWNFWGSDALATDPVDTDKVYIAAGMYTNSWDPSNGHILKSTNKGDNWEAFPLPFKVGGNMPGRGVGERLAIDPNNNKILYLGARSGKGLWKSVDAGETWTNVTNFPSVGTYIQDPSDSSGYTSDIIGITWVTFDKNSKTPSGSSRIFVGVANLGSDNVFVTTDSGATWEALAGQDNTFMSHKGVLSPAENALYLSYANGAGPFDGTEGYVKKFFIGNSSWLDITPTPGAGYGYGGLAVDLQKPGTIMVAPLNEWWPDSDIMRSTDGGATWSSIFNWGYPPPNYVGTRTPFYNYDVSRAPWISTFATGDTKQIGWMIEGLSIDPHDSDHWLYGTGLTVYGGHDLTNWDANPRKNITVASLATGLEETAVLDLTAPISGPLLVSAVGDVGGFVHSDLTKPSPTFTNPIWAGTVTGVDHAGASPGFIVRVSGISGGGIPMATSSDGGQTWAPYSAAPTTANGGKVAISANGDTILWTQANGLSGVQVSANGAPFAAAGGLPSGAIIASDKLNNSVFYSASGSKLFVSTNGGVSFTQTTTLGNANSANAIAVNPFTAGALFISTNVGIFHSTDFGKTLTQISGVSNAWSIALGAPKTSGGTPALFVAGTIKGVNSLYKTDDLGTTWNKLADAKHGFASTANMVLAADKRTYGQVFVGTNGRGIFYGVPRST